PAGRPALLAGVAVQGPDHLLFLVERLRDEDAVAGDDGAGVAGAELDPPAERQGALVELLRPGRARGHVAVARRAAPLRPTRTRLRRRRGRQDEEYAQGGKERTPYRTHG